MAGCAEPGAAGPRSAGEQRPPARGGGWGGTAPSLGCWRVGAGPARCLPPFCSHLHIFSFFFAILNILQDEGFEAGESILHVAEEPAGTWRALRGPSALGTRKFFVFIFLCRCIYKDISNFFLVSTALKASTFGKGRRKKLSNILGGGWGFFFLEKNLSASRWRKCPDRSP